MNDLGQRIAKVFVSLPAPLVKRIKQKVGTRGVSRYLAQALEHERREAGPS